METTHTSFGSKILTAVVFLLAASLLVAMVVLSYKSITFTQVPLPALDPTEPWTKTDTNGFVRPSSPVTAGLVFAAFFSSITLFSFLIFPDSVSDKAKASLWTVGVFSLMVSAVMGFVNYGFYISSDSIEDENPQDRQPVAEQTNQWAKARYNVDLKQKFSDTDIFDLTRTPNSDGMGTKTIVNIKGDSVKALHKDGQMILVEVSYQDKAKELPTSTELPVVSH